MQAKNVYKIAGIAFSLGSVIYFYQATTSLDFAWPWFSLGMSVGGICFLLVGLSFLIGPALEDNKKERLLQSGVTIDTQFVGVDFNWRIAVNNQHPYIIQSIGVDTTGQQQTFKSSNIWANPQPFLTPGQKIKVFIDPNNPKKYWMDISFLDNPLVSANINKQEY